MDLRTVNQGHSEHLRAGTSLREKSHSKSTLPKRVASERFVIGNSNGVTEKSLIKGLGTRLSAE